MFDTIAGLPLHPLVVHATEVVVPTAALVIALAALWPRFRRWARALPFALGLAALGLVPISTQSGEALQVRVQEGRLPGRDPVPAPALRRPAPDGGRDRGQAHPHPRRG